MNLHFLRALFVLLMASVGYFYVMKQPGPFGSELSWTALAVSITVAVLILSIDILSSRRKLLNLSAVLFGTIVGLAIGWVLGLAVKLLIDRFIPGETLVKEQLVAFLTTMLNVACCYVLVSFIMQTKDDIRFIIPYVEFAKQSRGMRPILLDTSVLIDGRLVEMAILGMVDSRLVVPRAVLDELQNLADSSDRLRRARGRRGLDMVGKLQANDKIELVIYEGSTPQRDAMPVDQQLVSMADEMDSRIMTTDYNLEKVAQLQGITVLNINEMASALKPVFLPGDLLEVALIKPGEQPGQAVGYLDDGTMVVIEHAREHIGGEAVAATVTSVVQTSAGRIVFGRPGEANGQNRRGGDDQVPRAQRPAV
jgi:uncharacterized protein YacL